MATAFVPEITRRDFFPLIPPKCSSSDTLDLRCQTLALKTLHSNVWLTRNY
jgi:hypothetical protein